MSDIVSMIYCVYIIFMLIICIESKEKSNAVLSFFYVFKDMEFFIYIGISFQTETPEKYKLVLQMSSQALGRKKIQ